MNDNKASDYREYAKRRLDALTVIFALASVGDFSHDIELPDTTDEFTQLYAGIQVMLDVIRGQLRGVNTLNADLNKHVADLKTEIDIRRSIEQELYAREEELRALSDNSPNLVARFDRNHRHVYVNNAVLRATGKSSKDYIGKTNDELGMPSDLVALWDARINDVFTNGKELSMEFDFPSPEGTKYYQSRLVPEFMKDGAIKYVLGVSHDVTDLKNVEIKLRHQTETLNALNNQTEQEKAIDEALLGSIGDGIVAVDRKGLITFLNKKAEDMLGWRKDELIGKSFVDTIRVESLSGDPIPTPDRSTTVALQTKQGVSMRGVYIRKDKSKLPIRKTVTPVILRDTLIGAIEIFHDISEQMEIERMKTEFLSMAAHQLRTPLGTMRWTIELLLTDKQYQMPDTVRVKIERLYEDNKRLIMLVSDLLNISRIEQGRFPDNPVAVNISDLTQNVVTQMMPEAQKMRVRIQTHVADGLAPEISVDPRRFEEVIRNILSNAIKYNSADGTVLVTVRPSNSRVEIEVQDTGIGIAKEDLPRIFNKFYRGENAILMTKDGTGLGLYIVNLLVKSWGGKTEVKSTLNKGTTITISLPVTHTVPKEGSA